MKTTARRTTRGPESQAPAPRASAVHDPFGLLKGLDLGPLAACALGDVWALGGLGLPAPEAYGAAADARPLAEDPATEIPSDWAALCEVCTQCGGQMHRGANNLEYVCADCGLLVEGDSTEPEDDDAPRAPPIAARLRIVGPNSNQLQPDLYRSGSGNTPAAQKKQLFEEYVVYRQRYIEAGGQAFPLNACTLAAEYYNAVQQACVKRSLNKMTIMAACLRHACIQIGYAPSKATAAMFMQLPNKGIARGDNFIRSLVADGKMDLDINADQSEAEIGTLFAALGFEGGQFAGLQKAVRDIVQTAIRSNIGTNSILHSKVSGATYLVLRRCKDRSLISKPPSMQEFCQKNNIRKNTLERFLREVDECHSYFEECYIKAGLESAPLRGRR